MLILFMKEFLVKFEKIKKLNYKNDFSKKIYEGKAKTIFSGPKENTLIQYFKDDATAFNAKKLKFLRVRVKSII